MPLNSSRHAIAARAVSRAFVTLCLFVAFGCDDAEHSPAQVQQAAVSTPKTQRVAWPAAPLSAPGAFDLILTTEGAELVWSPPVTGEQRAGLWSQRFSRDGVPTHAAPIPTLELAGNGHVIEVAGAAAAGQRGLAWVVREQERMTAWATQGAEHAARTSPGFALDEVEASAAGERGRVLMAAGEDGELQVTWRGVRARCEAQSGECSHYSRRSISRGRTDERAVIGREMLAPCDPMLIGSLWSDGSWYEAVCHHNPEPTGYLFSFRPAISYAEANEHFPGCDAFALSRMASGAALWAHCAQGLAVAIFSHDVALRRVEMAVERVISCRAGRPLLSIRKSGATVAEFALTSPTDALGAALPDHMAHDGARAVWTGSALLVAQRSDGLHVELRVGQCEGERLRFGAGS